MKKPKNPITVRIEWCRSQSAQAHTEPEVDGWHAEADGLRDALMNSDHTDNYRLCPPEIFHRYVLGFQDGTALLRVTRMECVVHDAITGTPYSATSTKQDIPLGDDR
jgi:hypothetical protein